MKSFQDIIQNTTPKTNREKVGLAVFCLQNFGGEDYVTTSDITAFFNMSKIKMGESAIAAHLHNLEENGLILRRERKYDSGYYLSSEGMRRFERLSNEEVGSPSPEEISGDELPKEYETLYERTGKIMSELKNQRRNTDEWRQKTENWRLFSLLSGLIGFIVGTGVNIFI